MMLVGFIYTTRSAEWINALRRLYFRILLAQVSVVVCHSSSEASAYAARLRLRHTQFVFIPFGTHVELKSIVCEPGEHIFSAGRSSRDYGVLIRAVSRLPYQARIACHTLDPSPLPPNTRVLSNCFFDDYIAELSSARLVVIPLIDNGLSAGQMVLLHAMACGKPAIITRTAATEEYVEDGQDALLVEPGDERSLSEAIEYLMRDREAASRIGANAAKTFRERYSLEAYAKKLYSCLKEFETDRNSGRSEFGLLADARPGGANRT